MTAWAAGAEVGFLEPAVAVNGDGRRKRTQRTRKKVVDSLIELVAEGEFRPTGTAVATRAGVAIRTLYHHFENMEELRAVARVEAWRRGAARLTPIDPSLPLDKRVVAVVGQLRRLYETAGPWVKSVGPDQGPPELAAEVRIETAQVDGLIASTFEREAAAAGYSSQVLLDALNTALSWATWDYLRSALHRTPATATKTVELLVTNLLEPTSS